MRVPWRKQTSFAPHTWFSGMPQAPLVTQHCHSGGRDVPASQYLALHWLSSPLIHHPALDLKERNRVNHPAAHTTTLPSPFRGPCGSQALLPLPGVFPWRILVPCGGWARPHVKKEGLLCFSHQHRWQGKTPPRTPTADDGEDTAEGRSGTFPAGTATPHSDHSCTCPQLRPHMLPWFSDTWLDKCTGRVYNQKWPCHQSDVNACLYLTSLSWFGHLGSLRKPSWKEPPCSCWNDSSLSLGFICKFPLCRAKLSNDICCLWGQSWTQSIKTNVSLSTDWKNCSEVIWRTSYFALERFLWQLNTQQYLILSKIAVYCLFN